MTPTTWFEAYLHCSGSGRIGHMWQCPCHRDARPSLSVSEGMEGRVLVKCFAGCPTDRVVEVLGLSMSALFESPPFAPERAWRGSRAQLLYPKLEAGGSGGQRARLGVPIETRLHYYTDHARLRRERFAGGVDKCVTWEHRSGPEWSSGLGLVILSELPLYRQAEALQGALCGEEVILCESESSVDALFDAGLYATTWAGGATSPNLDRLQTVLSDHRVLLVPDNDIPGLECSRRIREALVDKTASFRELLPAAGEDARDILRTAGTEAFRLQPFTPAS